MRVRAPARTLTGTILAAGGDGEGGQRKGGTRAWSYGATALLPFSEVYGCYHEAGPYLTGLLGELVELTCAVPTQHLAHQCCKSDGCHSGGPLSDLKTLIRSSVTAWGQWFAPKVITLIKFESVIQIPIMFLF